MKVNQVLFFIFLVGFILALGALTKACADTVLVDTTSTSYILIEPKYSSGKYIDSVSMCIVDNRAIWVTRKKDKVFRFPLDASILDHGSMPK
jgi:hypothetical protein